MACYVLDTYTDPRLLDTAAAIEAIGLLRKDARSVAATVAVDSVQTGQNLSLTDNLTGLVHKKENPEHLNDLQAFLECPGLDLNQQGVAPTTTSTLRVCQFRHLGRCVPTSKVICNGGYSSSPLAFAVRTEFSAAPIQWEAGRDRAISGCVCEGMMPWFQCVLGVSSLRIVCFEDPLAKLIQAIPSVGAKFLFLAGGLIVQ